MKSELTSGDPQASNIIKKTTKQEKGTMKQMRHSIAHFLIDFNVFPSSIAFLIAFVFRDFVNSLNERIVHIFIPKTIDDLLSKFITLIVTIVFCVLFVKYIFYGLFHSNEIVTEVAIKKAVTKKRENQVLKKLKKIKEV